jgi:hypothetical protein
MPVASEKTKISPESVGATAFAVPVFPRWASGTKSRTPRSAKRATIACVSSVEPSEATTISRRSFG